VGRRSLLKVRHMAWFCNLYSMSVCIWSLTVDDVISLHVTYLR